MSPRHIGQVRALLSRGLLTEAIALLRIIEAHSASDPDMLSMLGVALAMQGQRTEAEAYLRAALRAAPRVASLHSNLGNLLHEQGRFAEAEASLRRALTLRPDYPDALENLGVTQRALGHLREAETSVRTALRLRPDSATAHRNLSALLVAQGRFAEAIPALSAWARLQPTDAAAQVALAQGHRHCGHLAEAEAILRRILDADPADVAALIEQGSVLHAAGRFAEAEAAWHSAAVRAPGAPQPALGLGILAAEAGRYAPAEAHLRRAIALDPRYPEALNSLGDVLRNVGRFEEAEVALRAALALRPDYPEAQVSLAFLLLQTERFAQGWLLYEARWRVEAWRSRASPARAPSWQGQEPGTGPLLVHAEQGLGDTLQFVRYLRALPSGVRILLQVQAPLVRLLRTSFRDRSVEVVDLAQAADHARYQVPLLSLPRHLGDAEPAGRDGASYLAADPDDVARWRARLTAFEGLRVGLVWAGNPTLAADARRSLTLDVLAPLGRIGGLRLVSLQLGKARLRETPAGLDLYDPTPDLSDLADTAALVTGLDLVISVDTAVAHLAAALGKPVWLLNRHDTCWRWGRSGGCNRWYPTLREYRQTRSGDWGPVIARVADDLLAAVRRGTVGSGGGRMPVRQPPARLGDGAGEVIEAARPGD